MAGVTGKRTIVTLSLFAQPGEEGFAVISQQESVK
jgi:hypothetical protein